MTWPLTWTCNRSPVRTAAGLLALILTLAAPSGAAFAQDTQYRHLVGVLILPQLLGDGPCAVYRPRDVPFYAGPQADAEPAGRLFVSQQVSFAVNGGCTGPLVSAQDQDLSSAPRALPLLQYGYELWGAVVTETREGWARINTGDAYGWVCPWHRF